MHAIKANREWWHTCTLSWNRRSQLQAPAALFLD